MPLSDYNPRVEAVLFPGGSFEVRAISLGDLSLVIEVHETAINNIVSKVRSRQEIFNSGDDEVISEAIADILTDIIRESPALAANLIAVSTDEMNVYAAASRLPITVQLDALTKIAGLTFTDMASVKKLAADVMRLIRGMLPTATARAAE